MKIISTLIILALIASSLSITAQNAEKLTFEGLTDANDNPFEENGITWTVGGGGIAIGGGRNGGNAGEITSGAGILSWDKEIDITGLWISASFFFDNPDGLLKFTFRDKNYQTITEFAPPQVSALPDYDSVLVFFIPPITETVIENVLSIEISGGLATDFFIDDLWYKNPQATTFTWDGSEDSDWTNTKNWSSNFVPTGSVNVVIPDGTPHAPVINSGVTARCLDMQVQSGASITINGELILSGGN